jgi:hypothetical protein
MGFGEFLGESDGHGSEIQVDQARRGGFENTFIDKDGTDGVIVGEHAHEEVGTREVRRPGDSFCAFGDQFLDGLGGAIPHSHLVACANEASCYDSAHFTQADESDIHCNLRIGLEQASLPLKAPASRRE